MKKRLSTLFEFLERYEALIILLCLLIVLRIPNLFDPYWYGDEGIYLTIGVAMRQGARLYAEIIDHKTPIIYYLAMVPSQFWFRMLLMGWMLTATTFFYKITQKLQFSKIQTYLATFLFVVLTSIPRYEGHIPNGELFVIGFVMVGAWIVLKSRTFQTFLDHKPHKQFDADPTETLSIFAGGFFFGLAILTKVPALFDVVPFFFALLFMFVQTYHHYTRLQLIILVKRCMFLGLGVLTPILLSIGYYILRDSVWDYFNFGLLYNFRYAGSWGLPVENPVLLFFLSLWGKAIIFLTAVSVFVFGYKKFSNRTMILVLWTLASLIGATLSSRPYPHYLLQVLPPAILLLVTLLDWKKQQITDLAMVIATLIIVCVTPRLIGFNYYHTVSYYREFLAYTSGQVSQEEYFQQFNGLIRDNYDAARILKASSSDQIFIWGTNPMLYALSHKAPVGRFTVAFHIQEFPGAFDETYRAISNNPPQFIVVMKDERIEFQALKAFIYTQYLPFEEYEHMIIYKKSVLLDNPQLSGR